MSHAILNSSLSISARLLTYLGPPSIILITYFISPKTALLSPLAFLPTAWAYRQWHKANKADSSRHADLESLAWTFFLTGTLGLVAFAVIQGVSVYCLSWVFYPTSESREFFWQEIERNATEIATLAPEKLQHRTDMAQSLRYMTFSALICFGPTGLGEEWLKYIPVWYGSRRGTLAQRKRRTRAYLEYAIAGSLSFGLIEGIAFLYSAVEEESKDGPHLSLTLFERFLLGTFGHVLMAVLSGLRATRRDYGGYKEWKWWQVIGPSALIHGVYDFGAFAFSASDGNVGWVHPVGFWKTSAMLGVAMSVWCCTAGLVFREWTFLKQYEGKIDDLHEPHDDAEAAE